MPDRGFHPGSYVIWARTSSAINVWGPFTTADEAAHWASTYLESGKGRWSIIPVWDPKMVQAA